MHRLRWIAFLLFVSIAAPDAFAQEADLLVAKSGPESAAADTDVTYDVSVFNIGPDTSAAITLSDPIPAGMTFVAATPPGCTTPAAGSGGTITCVIASLAAGSSADYTFVFHIPAGTAPGTTFVNIATASSATDPTDENNSGVAATSTPPPPLGDMTLSKNGPSTAGPGTDVVFTIDVTNTGPEDASNVSVSDTLPGDLTFVSLVNTGFTMSCSTPAVGSGGTITCTAASFPPGVTATLTLTAHVPAGTASGTQYVNNVAVKADNDPNPDNDAAAAIVTVSSVDVSVDKNGPASVTAGTNASYTITVTSSGPDAAVVNFTDDIPSGTSFVSLAQDPSAFCSSPPAGSTSGTVSCTMSMSAPFPASAQFTLVLLAGNTTSITNIAAVTTDSFDDDPSNNSDTFVTTVTPSADLSVTKSGPATVTAGENVTYTITVTNDGPTDASSVSLTDSLPPELTFVSMTQTSGPTFNCSGTTCTIATLPLDATATFSLVAQVASSLTGASPVSNTANVSAATGDPVSPNNMSMTSAAVTRNADMSAMKSGPPTVIAGTNITYTVTVRNDGPSDAFDASMSDTLPPGTTFVSSEQTSGPVFTCVEPPVGGTGTITCSIPSLVADAPAVFSIVLNVSPGTTGSITNPASAGSTTADLMPGNNSSTSTAVVNPPPTDVRLTKSVIFSPTTAIYTIEVTNIGPADAFGTVVTDTLPGGTAFSSASSTQGSCSGTSTVTCNLGTITTGNSATITINVQLTQPNGTISNTADVTIENGDTAPANNTATATFIAGGGAPTLSTIGMVLLALGLGIVAVYGMRT